MGSVADSGTHHIAKVTTVLSPQHEIDTTSPQQQTASQVTSPGPATKKVTFPLRRKIFIYVYNIIIDTCQDAELFASHDLLVRVSVATTASEFCCDLKRYTGI